MNAGLHRAGGDNVIDRFSESCVSDTDLHPTEVPSLVSLWIYII